MIVKKVKEEQEMGGLSHARKFCGRPGPMKRGRPCHEGAPWMKTEIREEAKSTPKMEPELR